jgi:hypothetical protein
MVRRERQCRPARKSALCGFLFACAALFFLLTFPHSGRAERWTETLNLGDCSADPEGMIYLALWETVMRFPAASLKAVSNFGPGQLERAPVPFDTDDPEGCPANPIRALGYIVMLDMTEFAATDTESDEILPDVMGIQLISFDPARVEPFKNYYDLFDTCLERVKALGDRIDPSIYSTAEGLRVCLYPRDDFTLPQSRWWANAMADEGAHSFPNGEAYVLRCSSEDAWGRECDVHYRFRKFVWFSYKFYDGQIPLESAIRLDRGIRDVVGKAVVDGFSWKRKMIPNSAD